MKRINLLNKPVVLENGKNSIFFRNGFATYTEGYNPAMVLRVCLGEIKSHKGESFRFATDKEIAFIKSGDSPGVMEEVVCFEC